MLHVLCRIGRDAYAIPGTAVERILPFAALKELPGAEHGLAGLLNYRSEAVPVADLCLILTGTRARELISTRIFLCPLAESPSGWLGLLAEGVTKTQDFSPESFQAAGVAGRSCLEGVAPSLGGLVQRIAIRKVLPDGLLAALDLPARFPA
ncbi:MAG TPA: chemotaxis protein CheW [Terrimicrobiaceae bacterium]|nr:chemotaxis protein CheW [Terrimicrobiaceae bacterium]